MLPELAVPISVCGCFATRRRVELSVPVDLRTGRWGRTRVLPLMAILKPRIRNTVNVLIHSRQNAMQLYR